MLNDRDLVASVSYEDIIESEELALCLYEESEFYQPERIRIDNKKEMLLMMPCFVNGFFGTKIISLFPEN